MRSSLLSLVSALLLVTAQASGAQAPRAQDLPRWKAQAARVTIIRDHFGVPHVYGRTDADAVFGMIYAQAEDDFNRVETNYINAMGRLAEVEGERELYRDLRMKLFIDTLDMKRQYAASPAWLKTLMVAWADGLNYFMATHPEKKPRLITRYQPWMALTFSEGSIGGDIESVNLRGLEQFYGPRMSGGAAGTSPQDAGAYDLDGEPVFKEPGGSNGFAIAPSITATGNAMLLINPHTSFYFRPEIHVVSEQGLNAYGAVTWGQFFVYQGFNPRVGWMHTSGGGDVIDEYLETVTEARGRVTYTVGGTQRPMRAVKIGLPYKTPTV
jgi:acyl-homoserine-lactone acylase